MSARPVKLLKWSPYVNAAKTQLAFFSVELPSGLVVKGLRLMVGPKGARFVGMPSIKQTDGTWSDILHFRDRATRDRFQNPLLEILEREHPEVFL